MIEEKAITWREIPIGGTHHVGPVVVVFVGIIKAENPEKGGIVIRVSNGIIGSSEFPYKVRITEE